MGQQDGIIRVTQISDFVAMDNQLIEINCFPIFPNLSHDVLCINIKQIRWQNIYFFKTCILYICKI